MPTTDKQTTVSVMVNHREHGPKRVARHTFRSIGRAIAYAQQVEDQPQPYYAIIGEPGYMAYDYATDNEQNTEG